MSSPCLLLKISTILVRVLCPRWSSRTLHRPSAVVSVATLVTLAGLTACGGSGTDQGGGEQPETAAATPGTAEPEESPGAPDEREGTADPGDSELTEPGALDDDEKLDVLLSSADLPVSPDGHSTYEELSYFQESIAVEYTHYQETFDESECAAAMDRINVDLVGEDPQSGLAHAYSLPPEEGTDTEYRPQIYVWMLSYDREVDTSSVWNYVHEHCTGGELESGTDQVEIQPFVLEDRAELDTDGISMVIHRDGEPIASSSAVRHSMTVDFGDNLVMFSAVGLDDAEFSELAAVQAQKLADFAEALDEDA